MHIQVCYGVFHNLDETPRRRYVYDDRGLGVAVGDIVTVPSSGLSERRDGHRDGQRATVVEIGWRYDGPVSSIIGIVERRAERQQQQKQAVRQARALRRAAKQLGQEQHPEAITLLNKAADELLASHA